MITSQSPAAPAKNPPTFVLCEVGDPGIAGLESFSPFCLKVHRALKVLGLPYTSRHGRPDQFKHLNRTGQIPVLLSDDKPVADSTEIVKHIQQYSSRNLTPSDNPTLTAQAWLWEEFADTVIYGFVVACRWADEENWQRTKAAFFSPLPFLLRDMVAAGVRKKILNSLTARDVWRAGAPACWARLANLLRDLDTCAPTRGYWVGESLSIADIALFAQLHSLRTPLTPVQAQELAQYPNLSAYLDRIQQETYAPSAS